MEQDRPNLKVHNPEDRVPGEGANPTAVLTPPRPPSLRISDFPRAAQEFQFLKCLEQNPLGELWKVSGPDGKFRLAQFLPHGVQDTALEKLQFLQVHKGLLAVEMVRRANGQVLLVSDLWDKTLRDRFQECWQKGLPGIIRDELLSYFRIAAETLDSLHQKFRMQHLGLQPRSLVLKNGSLCLGGFGLGQLIWLATGQPVADFNPRYAAPEAFSQRTAGASDQYSLALIYAELATGVHPWRGLREGAPNENSQPDLALLSSGEQKIIRRALSFNARDRFPNLSEMVRLLEEEGTRREEASQKTEPLGQVIAYSQYHLNPAPTSGSLDEFVSELVLMATGPAQVQEFRKIRYTLEAGRQLVHRCAVRTFPGAALLKLEGFRQQWQASLVHHKDNVLVLSVHVPPPFWQKLIGRRIGLEIRLNITAPRGGKQSEVLVVIRPFGCTGPQALRLLQETGPQVLESLRAYLQALPEQRTTERLAWNQPLRVRPVIGGIELDEPIDCLAKDISAGGIGFFLPRLLTSPQVYVNMPEVPEFAAYAGLAQVVRRQPRPDGWYEIGASFSRQK